MKNVVLKVLFCLIPFVFVACGNDSSESSPNEASVNQGDEPGSTLAKPCNDNGVNNCVYGTLEDARDGKVYRTITIGNQEWMAENLNFAAHNSFCIQKDNCKENGRLYSFGAVYDTSSTHCVYEKRCDVETPIQGVCPSGWHVPSLEEWKSLFRAVGGKKGIKLLFKDSAWGDEFSYHDAYGFGLAPSPKQDLYSRQEFVVLAYEYNSPDGYEDMTGYRSIDQDAMGSFIGGYDYFIPLGFNVRCLRNKDGETGTTSQMVAETETRTKAWDYLNPTIEYGTMEDSRDGQVYKTVMMGEDTWMAQNLNYNTGDGQSTCFNDEDASCEKFGRLYTRELVRSEDVCPAGWHIPTSEEWYAVMTLTKIDGKAYESRLFAKDAWYKLYPDSIETSDEFGFSALPAGNLYTETIFAEEKGYITTFSTHSSNIRISNDSLVSVRCVMNEEK